MADDNHTSQPELPEDLSLLGIDCPSGHYAVDVKYENQATTTCSEGMRHRYKYYCKDSDSGEKDGPRYTNWICGQ